MPENYDKFVAETDPISTGAMDQFEFLVKPDAAASASEQDEDAATSGMAFPGGINGCCCEDDEGFKTPTLPGQRIPLDIKQCPPVPRKPRRIPARAKIRKPWGRGRRLLLDFTSEVEAMFPLAIRKNFRRKIEPSKVTSQEGVGNKLS